MITSSLEVFIWPVQHVKRLSFICGLDHLPILKNVGEDLDTNYVISVNPISIYLYFSQNQNKFGCFDAAVLFLVLAFFKELI